MAIKKLTKYAKEMMAKDVHARVAVARQSFYHFLITYLADDFELKPAPFHRDMIDSLDSIDDLNKYLAILGFRGSAKSTILEAFALWSMLNGKHNFIVYIRSTIDDAKMSLANIRNRIEENKALQEDFNIVLEDRKSNDFREKWSESQITIGNCTMMARSKGQKIRGVKFKKARIDLIIGDDIEDIKDADTREKREATRKWFFAEVLPATKQGALADNVKVVLLGNLVHKDCLIKHLSKSKTVKTLEFWVKDKDGNITWKGLYPTEEALEAEHAKVLIAGEGLGEIIWAREYLGIEIDIEDAVINMGDIQYYPDAWLQRTPLSAGVGVDFAISQKQTADYTAMVKGMEVANDNGERRLLILKNNVQKRMTFEETIATAVEINEIMPHGTKFYPEKVAYQQAAIEIMEKNGLRCVPMSSVNDKKSRLIAACFYVKTGRVLFPETGAEDVINNIIGFGIEAHDDYADAFVNIVLGMVKKSGGLLIG